MIITVYFLNKHAIPTTDFLVPTPSSKNETSQVFLPFSFQVHQSDHDKVVPESKYSVLIQKTA